MSPRSNALYQLKRALRYGDEDAYRKYMLKHYELGGSERGLEQSIESLHPLSGLSDNERQRFQQEFLDPSKLEKLGEAIRYYEKVIQGTLADMPERPEGRRLRCQRRASSANRLHAPAQNRRR